MRPNMSTSYQRAKCSYPQLVWFAIGLLGLLIALAFWLAWAPSPIQAQAQEPSVISQSLPQELVPLDGIVQVAAGGSHTCALTTAGGVKCWGNNGRGQLGDGSKTNQTVPVGVVGLGSDVAAIAGGDQHTCALTTAGGIKCWGNNGSGQLGDDSTVDKSTPVDVVGLDNGVAAISGNSFHTCALTTAGGIKCWGRNVQGQLGDGSFIDRNTPVDVVGLGSGVGSIYVSQNNTCALTTAGGVKCWGSNHIGAVGDGTILDKSTPVDVVGLGSGVVVISGGYSHICALTTAGGVKCWGNNYSGQLGDGTILSKRTPVDVVGLGIGVVAISGGQVDTCALTTAGGVKCWGNNRYGQLGDGTWANKRTPVDVVGVGSSVSAISTGLNHTCALTITGGVRCWGYNANGQLGDGTILNKSTPVDVLVEGTGYTISGKITDIDSQPIAGVDVRLDNSKSVQTNSTGLYTFTNVLTGTHAIAPGKPGFIFIAVGQSKITVDEPTSVEVLIKDNKTGLDFVGAISPYSVGPFLDLPVAHNGTFAQVLLGNYGGYKGRVNSWFDHTYPNQITNTLLTKWSGEEFTTFSQGKSYYDGHEGIDFSQYDSKSGTENILASASGIVTRTKSTCIEGDIRCGGLYGNQVWIDHGNGYATLYAHLDTVVVSDGDPVSSGTILGTMGNTGRSFGTHLHFGLHYHPLKRWSALDTNIDPYGWWAIDKSDPYSSTVGLASILLWKQPLNSQAPMCLPEGATLASQTGDVAISCQAPGTGVIVQIIDTPAHIRIIENLRSLGVSFTLRITDGQQAGNLLAVSSNSFPAPVTLTVSNTNVITRHLDISQSAIYWFDAVNEEWSKLESTVDLESQTVNAVTQNVGMFEVQAPLACSADTFEFDDTFYQASELDIKGDSALHVLDIPDDEDWMWFEPITDTTYSLQLTDLGAGVSTNLELVAPNGVDVIEEDSSKIVWTAPDSRRYYVRVSPQVGSLSGCSAEYKVAIVTNVERSQIFVPVVQR